LAAFASAFNRMAADLGTRDEQLKAADRTRRILLADVSHELMTPLTAMRAYREVLAMSELGRDPEAAHRLAVMGDETHRMERLVGDLLDLARLEAGGDSLQCEDVAVENLFGRVAARHEPEAALKGVALVTSIASGAEILHRRGPTLVGGGIRRRQRLGATATYVTGGGISCGRAQRTQASCPSATPVRAFRRSISRSSSIASTKSIQPGRATPRPAAGSVSPLSKR
jgi:hypothetical protein